MSIEVELGLENFDKVPVADPGLKPRRIAEGWANPKLRWAAAAAGVLVVALLIALYLHYHGRQTTDDAQVDGHMAPVSAKISGMVAEVLVTDNQPVKAGQLLVQIDPRDYQAKVSQARAALAMTEGQSQGATIEVPMTRETTASGKSGAEAQQASAEADLARANLSYEQARTSDLAYAQAELEKRRANDELAKADLARMRPLAQKEEISKQQLDAFESKARVEESELKAAEQKLAQAQRSVEIARAQMLAAQARVAQARSGVQDARANVGRVQIRGAEAKTATAAVQQAKANLEMAELNLGYATIVAPIDGVVTHKQVEVGQNVQPGQALLMVVPLQDLWVTANFKETQLAKVKQGQKAEIKVDMYGRTFPGHVDSIAGATGARLSLLPPENATGNYVKVVQRIPVKIALDPIPPDQAVLRPGMNVDATIITQ
ncbi:MAG TPA: HlyD family secretion protein [Candidatus Dormibacteraeota bacterium]|nr:HlyD family secretion protein [Candidatus Dormibacteraeota bacterium]